MFFISSLGVYKANPIFFMVKREKYIIFFISCILYWASAASPRMKFRKGTLVPSLGSLSGLYLSIHYMSIVALKRKTKTLYNNQSVGENGFSINGTRRGMSYIGQSLASRNLERKYIRGASTGGCCGTHADPNQSTGMCCVNDNKVIKKSAMNTTSYLLNKTNHTKPVVKKYKNDYQNRIDSLLSGLTNDNINAAHQQPALKQCSPEMMPYFRCHFTRAQTQTTGCDTTKKLTTEYDDVLLRLRTKCGVGNYYVSSSLRAPLPGNSKL